MESPHDEQVSKVSRTRLRILAVHSAAMLRIHVIVYEDLEPSGRLHAMVSNFTYFI